MDGIMDILEKSTKKLKGQRYQSHKFCYDTNSNSVIEYDDNNRSVEWKNKGETEKLPAPKDLTEKIEDLKGTPTWFNYALDGSRHVYKVDDMSFKNNVYPIIAGQVGIACCNRFNKVIGNEFFYRKLVMALPRAAIDADFKHKEAALKLLAKLNKSDKLLHVRQKFNQPDLKLDDLLLYTLDTDEKYESKGIAMVQDYMVECEKNAVMELVKQKKLNDHSYLIKDGTIEYKQVHSGGMNLTEAKLKSAYRYVIGVSKSFNPTLCKIKGGGTNSSIIASLRENERTPAACFTDERLGNSAFCVWYIRLRDKKYTKNIFDGVIKVEKLIQDDELQYGVDTDLIDTISAYLIMERNPVCYGKDGRWANHLYMVSCTENFAKSKYMSSDTFMSMF